MKNILLIIFLFIGLFSFSQNDTLTLELNQRIKDNNPYPSDAGQILLPNEPYVITDKIIEPYNNYRAFEKDGKIFIPVATYTNGCRDSYTLFEECVEWFKVYRNIQVGVMAKLQDNEEIFN